MLQLQYNVTVDKTIYDFGHIDRNKDTMYTCIFKIRNESDNEMEITGVDTSCSCMEAAWTNGKIPAGKMGIVRIEYFPEQLREGYFEKKIKIFINNSEEPETVKISGTYDTR